MEIAMPKMLMNKYNLFFIILRRVINKKFLIMGVAWVRLIDDSNKTKVASRCQ